MNLYGQGKRINTDEPFDVKVTVDSTGSMTTRIQQNGQSVTTFDQYMAGAFGYPSLLLRDARKHRLTLLRCCT